VLEKRQQGIVNGERTTDLRSLFTTSSGFPVLPSEYQIHDIPFFASACISAARASSGPIADD
jgi:hypothetical protein